METTAEAKAKARERYRAQERLEDELSTLSSHLNAATARWLELVASYLRGGELADEPVRWLAFRFGVTAREAREYLRVAEAVQELPAIRAAFACGALTYCKVRALTRVATPASEEGLLELAEALTAPQLELALRAFRRLAAEEVREAHELEYVDYYFADDGSLYLRARLPAEDGTLLVKALEAARERVHERRREEKAASVDAESDPALAFEPPRAAQVEALVELAETALEACDGHHAERARLHVHVDAAALTADHPGRCELAEGPVISPETARRLGCDAETMAMVERDGLPLSLGRSRRTVPPALRRALEARDGGSCCFPGCERRRFLQACIHWAQGGETSLRNLVLLCFHHHRLVHEGGYTIEDDEAGGLRFRNRHGVLCPSLPPRSPPGSVEALVAENERLGLAIGPHTNRTGYGDPLDLELAVAALRAA